MADLATDFGTLKLTHADAQELLAKDPRLEQPAHGHWRREIKDRFSNLVPMA